MGSVARWRDAPLQFGSLMTGLFEQLRSALLQATGDQRYRQRLENRRVTLVLTRAASLRLPAA